MKKDESANVKAARDIIAGKEGEPGYLLGLGLALKSERAFGLARKVLARAFNSQGNDQPELRLEIAQQLALCTYKDPDLSADVRLDTALDTLKKVERLSETRNQQTLGLAGAIYKRKWDLAGQRQHLERALYYYRRGYEAGNASGADYDRGYTGINAAFVMDLLGAQEEAEAREAGTVSESAEVRRKEAARIREELIKVITDLMAQPGGDGLANDWWVLVTIAEAYFGLRRYTEASPWLARAASLTGVANWEREATARQLARLAQLQEGESASFLVPENSEAWKALSTFLGNSVAGVRAAFAGKIGLALSGGGFRASLYHIGVLARLAELDVLRRVEVISCVSGGSIIGAHYYLEARKLLESKPDSEITREDYIAIVQRVEKDFLLGVQRNIRTRVAAEWLTNLKMIFLSHYSRTRRAGELYEEEIFKRAVGGDKKEPIYLSKLFIQPPDGPDGFKPAYDNWRRESKVPVLILNATSLNTGHNWQFTASWMGEPPGAIDTDIDSNYRLRRMYYADAPAPYKDMRLGHAVAASACVPGIFEPLALPDLYESKQSGDTIRPLVRLVDGGVHDNQGVAGLLDQGCSVLLVSDASGQMESRDDPSSGLLGVPLRSNSILMARVRDAQYHDLKARRRASLLQGLMYVHLKLDLEPRQIDWINCNDPSDASESALPPERRGPLTRYGVSKKIQEQIAAIRTDLDSFSDAEAYALMTSAYLMTDYMFPRAIKHLSTPAQQEVNWEFLCIDEAMKGNEGSEQLMRLLKVSNNLAFKVWKLSALLKFIARLLGLMAILAFIWVCWTYWGSSLIKVTVGMIATTLLAAAAARLVGSGVVRVVQWRKTLNEFLLGVGMSLFGFIAARIHLHIFDKMFLKLGRVDRLTGTGPSDVKPPEDSQGSPDASRGLRRKAARQ